MGIKSGLSSVRKVYLGSTPVKEIYCGTNLVFSFERGNLSLWRYSNDVIQGKTLLYKYLGSYENLPDNTLYVPRVGGKAVINNSTWFQSDAPFVNNPNLIKVDLQKVPFRFNSMMNAFYNCRNLISVLNIPEHIINMYGTYSSCHSFNQNIQISDTVTDMFSTFSDCDSLNQNIRIPNNVADMGGTFRFCYNFNQRVQIPESVTRMIYTFEGCNSLNQNIYIPSNVSDLSSTFALCPNFNSWINISATNVFDMSNFFNTWTTTQTSIPNVFFVYKYANDKQTNTANNLNKAGWKFNGTGQVVGPNNYSKIRTWDDGANYNTRTYNGTHCILKKWSGTLDTFLNNNSRWTTPVVPERLFLSNIPTAINYQCFRANTSITSVDFGSEIPWDGNKLGSTIKKNGDTYINGAFEGCTSLVSIKGVVNPNVTSLLDSFSDSYSIKDVDVVFPEGATNGRGVYYNCINITNHSPLPSTITSMYDYFGRSGLVTGKLANSMIIPPAVTNMSRVFANRQENVGNIYVLSPTISNIDNVWEKYPTTFKKPFYIYYKYSNNANTATYELFKKKAVFYGTSGNGAGVNPMYNSTSNFYVYDLSSVYNNLWNHTIYLTPVQKLVKLIKYKGNDKHVALMTNYPDLKPHIFDVNCFNNCGYIKTLALYDANIDAFAGSCTNMFRNCYNLRVIQGLRLDKVVGSTVGDTNVNLPYSFENCYNLRVMSSIPSNVKSMHYTFRNCYNLDFNIQIKEGVRNMVGAFSGCTNLNKNIKIPSTVINISDIFYGCYNLNQNIQIPANVTNMKNAFYFCRNLYGRIDILSNAVVDSSNCFMGCSKFKEVYIPYRYMNGVNSKTFNSFVSAGYLYSNGASTGKNNTRFYNIVL